MGEVSQGCGKNSQGYMEISFNFNMTYIVIYIKIKKENKQNKKKINVELVQGVKTKKIMLNQYKIPDLIKGIDLTRCKKR